LPRDRPSRVRLKEATLGSQTRVGRPSTTDTVRLCRIALRDKDAGGTPDLKRCTQVADSFRWRERVDEAPAQVGSVADQGNGFLGM
jgi:hypothetical protein